MLQSFFSSENPIFRFTGWVLDIMVLSILWLVCSLPVATIGPATAALYYSCVKCLRYKAGGAYQSFFSAFRLNLRTGSVTTVLLLALALPLAVVWAAVTAAAGTGEPVWGVLQSAYLVLLLIPLSVLTCAFPLLSRFTYTPGKLLATSLRLTFRHLPRLLLAALVNGAFILITLRLWYCAVMLLTPALDALAVSFLLEPVFRRYTPSEGTEDKPWYLR